MDQQLPHGRSSPEAESISRQEAADVYDVTLAKRALSEAEQEERAVDCGEGDGIFRQSATTTAGDKDVKHDYYSCGSCGGAGADMLGVVFPKIERNLSWSTYVAIKLWACIPTALYILCCTRMGYGLYVYSYVIMEQLQPRATQLAIAVAFYGLALYLLDVLPVLHPTYVFVWRRSSTFQRYQPSIRLLQQFALLVGGLGVALVVLSRAGDYPYGPIALFIVTTSLWMLLLRKAMEMCTGTTITARQFIGWCSGPFMVVSVVVFITWITWTICKTTGQSHKWSDREFFHVVTEAEASACAPNLQDFPDCEHSYLQGEVCFTVNHDDDTQPFTFPQGCNEACAMQVYDECLNPFLLWVGPFLVSLCLLFLSFMSTFLRTTTTTASSTTTNDAHNNITSTSTSTRHITSANNHDAPEQPHNVDDVQHPPPFSSALHPDERGQSYHSQQQQQQQQDAFASISSNDTPLLLPIDTVQKDDMARFAKLWLLLLFGMWVSASLAGAGAGLSTTLTAMTVAALVASAIFVAVSFSALERKQHVATLAAALAAQEREHAVVYDAIKGLLVLTCAPVAVLLLPIAMLKQCVRRLCCGNAQAIHHLSHKVYHEPSLRSLEDTAATTVDNSNATDKQSETEQHDTRSCCNTTGSSNGGGWITVEAQRLMDWVQSWDRRTRVFTYAVYWGVAFVTVNVIVAQFTLLFLSWLVEKTSVMPLASVTAILLTVGLCMFLLPPVPGPPIYLTLGIVIVPVGRSTLGIPGSMVYAVVVSLGVKLLACTLQQKVIGGLLQHRIAVRQFVGVNSKLIRSMKLILAEPGFTLAKCSVLVGGPDWPTSVLCGIMDLPLIPILLGTLPIVLLIVPTLLTGCFTYMGGLQVANSSDNDDSYIQQQEEFPWADTVATVCAALAGLVQFGSMVLAAYYVEQTVSQRGDELEAMPLDQEVLAADAKHKQAKSAYEHVTEWHRVPACAKFVLSTSLVVMVLSCYLLQSLPDSCFTEYELTNTIDEHLRGDWTALVLPLGSLAIGLSVISVLLLLFFTTWAKKEAAVKMAQSAPGTEEETPYASLS